MSTSKETQLRFIQNIASSVGHLFVLNRSLLSRLEYTGQVLEWKKEVAKPGGSWVMGVTLDNLFPCLVLEILKTPTGTLRVLDSNGYTHIVTTDNFIRFLTLRWIEPRCGE